MELQSNPNSPVEYLYCVSSSDNMSLWFSDIYSPDEFYFQLAFPYFYSFFFLNQFLLLPISLSSLILLKSLRFTFLGDLPTSTHLILSRQVVLFLDYRCKKVAQGRAVNRRKDQNSTCIIGFPRPCFSISDTGSQKSPQFPLILLNLPVAAQQLTANSPGRREHTTIFTSVSFQQFPSKS